MYRYCDRIARQSIVSHAKARTYLAKSKHYRWGLLDCMSSCITCSIAWQEAFFPLSKKGGGGKVKKMTAVCGFTLSALLIYCLSLTDTPLYIFSPSPLALSAIVNNYKQFGCFCRRVIYKQCQASVVPMGTWPMGGAVDEIDSSYFFPSSYFCPTPF